jgi:hypothetical protein
MISVVMFIDRIGSRSTFDYRAKFTGTHKYPAVRQPSWMENIANVYDYLWGFLTWSYKFSILSYCTMALLFWAGWSANIERAMLGLSSNFNACSFVHTPDHPDILSHVTCACEK